MTLQPLAEGNSVLCNAVDDVADEINPTDKTFPQPQAGLTEAELKRQLAGGQKTQDMDSVWGM